MIKVFFTIFLILVACQAQEEEFSQNLRIAIDPTSPPFESLENGVLVGLDIDFLAAVAAAGGVTYEIVQVPWDNLFQQVKDNAVDLAISGITINDVRKETYDFSVPYFLSTHKILILEGTPIASASDLVGKVVAVREGTTGAVAVERILGADNPNIKRYPDSAQGIQAVTNREVDAYVDDNAILEYFAKNNPGYVVVEDSNAFAKELYGLMFPKGSELRVMFNEAITTVLESGEYDRIYTQWFGTVPDVMLLLEAGEEEDPYDIFSENQETELEWDEEGETGEIDLEWIEGGFELGLED